MFKCGRVKSINIKKNNTTIKNFRHICADVCGFYVFTVRCLFGDSIDFNDSNKDH